MLRFRQKRGVALGLAFLVFVVLTMLVVAMLSIQKQRSRSTAQYRDRVANEFAVESALEHVFAGIESEGSAWGQSERPRLYPVKKISQSFPGSASYFFNILALDRGNRPVVLKHDQSYLNYSLMPRKIRIMPKELGNEVEEFRLPPYSGYLVIYSSSAFAMRKDRVIVDLIDALSVDLGDLALFSSDGDILLRKDVDIKRWPGEGENRRIADFHEKLLASTSREVREGKVEIKSDKEKDAVIYINNNEVVWTNRHLPLEDTALDPFIVDATSKDLHNMVPLLDQNDREKMKLEQSLYSDFRSEKRFELEGLVKYVERGDTEGVSADLNALDVELRELSSRVENPFSVVNVPELVEGASNRSSRKLPRANRNGVVELKKNESYFLDKDVALNTSVELNEATLYIDGDLDVRGDLRGKGSFYVTGTTTLRGDQRRAKVEDRVFIFSDKNIHILRNTLIDSLEQLGLRGDADATDLEVKKAIGRLERTFESLRDDLGRAARRDFKGMKRRRDKMRRTLDSWGDESAYTLRGDDFQLLMERLRRIKSPVSKQVRSRMQALVLAIDPNNESSLFDMSELLGFKSELDEERVQRALDVFQTLDLRLELLEIGRISEIYDPQVPTMAGPGVVLGAYEIPLDVRESQASFKGFLCSRKGAVISQVPLHMMGMIFGERGILMVEDLRIRADALLFKEVFLDGIEDRGVMLWLP